MGAAKNILRREHIRVYAKEMLVKQHPSTGHERSGLSVLYETKTGVAMTEFTRTWEASDKQYEFYDYGDTTPTYGIFSGLTGGDMTISMVSYNTIGDNGGVVTKFLPGQTTYAPIRLSGPQSDTMPALTDWFNQAVNGNFDNLRRHCSIAQYKMSTDSAGVTTATQLVVWELINLMPIAMPGFSYNSYQKTASPSYKLLFQAEEIIVTFP